MKQNSQVSRRMGHALWLLLAALTCPAAPSTARGTTETPIQGPAPERERPPLPLLPSEQRMIHLPGMKRYSLGGAAARAIAPPGHGDALLIKGVQPGTSDLWVWFQDGSTEHRSIQVEKPGTAGTSLSLPVLRALSRLSQTEILYTSDGVVLRGSLDSADEAARIEALVRGTREIRDETEATERLLLEGQSRLQNWGRRSNREKEIRIERSGQHLWVKGALHTPSERQAAEQEARAVFPRCQIELDSLPDSGPTIHFKAFLLEIRRNRMTALGLQWPELVPEAAQVSSQAIREAIHLDLAIRALEGEGSARVLSSPELVVRAPGEAELFSGGEIPIRASAQFFSNVTWKPHGLTLKLKVGSVSGERVRLEIQTEVSHLSPDSKGDPTVPALEANRLKTQVDARFKTPLFLSGLLKQGTREHSTGLPLLSQIPLIGSLFGSRDQLDERTELVAVLLPDRTPPEAPMREFERSTPRGPVPPPRNWISLEREKELKADPHYPWNAFE